LEHGHLSSASPEQVRVANRARMLVRSLNQERVP
jgi:hypothetical protein